jgi:hypothetical protein
MQAQLALLKRARRRSGEERAASDAVAGPATGRAAQAAAASGPPPRGLSKEFVGLQATDKSAAAGPAAQRVDNRVEVATLALSSVRLSGDASAAPRLPSAGLLSHAGARPRVVLTKERAEQLSARSDVMAALNSARAAETKGEEHSAAPQAGAAPRFRDVIVWRCKTCKEECVPVRSESRCLCGHRLKEHPRDERTGRHKCGAQKCACADFLFIVAEGAWVLKCQCKHKAVEHNPQAGPHPCTRRGCQCLRFHSPWVCNCNHAHSEHEQLLVQKRVKTAAELWAGAEDGLAIGGDVVKRTDLLAEPLMLGGGHAG